MTLLSPARTLLLATLLAPAGLELATRYETARDVRIVTVTELALDTTAFEMLVDGEPFERGGARAGFSTRELRRVVQIDRRLEVEAGAPQLVRRSFESIAGNVEIELGGESQELEREAPLAGVTLELTRDGDEVVAEVVEGDAPDDDELLEGHRLELALDAFLPAGSVAEGDSWSLDADQVRRGLGWDVEAALFPRPERDELEFGDRGDGRRGAGRGGRGRGGEARLLAAAEWDGKATLVAAEEASEHGNVARIKLELEASGELPEPEGGGGFGRGRAPRSPHALHENAASPTAPAVANTYEFELEGELLWSIEHRRPVRLELEGKLLFETRRESEREGRTFSMSSTREGTVHHSVTVTREEPLK